MSAFNPTVPDTNDPNYLNWSKPISDLPGNKAWGAALSGAGDMLKATVSAADEWIKKDIDDKVTKQVDEQKNALETGLENIRLAQVNGTATGGAVNLLPQDRLPDVPGGVKNGLDRINTLQQARDQNSGSTGNSINDTYYSGNITAIAKNIRAEYPGYRDYIDSKVSAISGLPVANSYYKNLMADINHAATNANDANKKADNLLMDGVKSGYKGFDVLYERRLRGQASNQDIVDAYFDQSSKDRLNTQAREKLALQRGTIEADQTMAVASYGDEAARTTDTFLRTVTIGTPFGQMSSKEFMDGVDSGKFKMTPTQAQEMAPVMEGVRRGLNSALIESANKTNPNGTPSYAVRAGGLDKLKGQIEQQNTIFSQFTDGIVNEKYGLAWTARNWANAASSETGRRMYEDEKIGPRMLLQKQMRSDFGDNFSNILIEDAMKMDLQNDLKEYFTNKLTKAITTPPPGAAAPSAIEDVQQAKKNGIGIENPEETKYYQRILEIPKIVGNTEAPMKARINAANYAFGPKNRYLLREFNQDYRDPTTGQWVEGKIGAFYRMSSPDVVQGMIDLKNKGGPQGKAAYDNWRNFIDLSINEAVGGDVRNLGEIKPTGKNDVKVAFNSETNTFELRDASGRNPLPRRSADPTAQGYLNTIHDSTDRINLVLSKYVDIAKATGQNPNEMAIRILVQSGYTPGPTTTGFPKMMMDAARIANQKITNQARDREEKALKRAQEDPTGIRRAIDAVRQSPGISGIDDDNTFSNPIEKSYPSNTNGPRSEVMSDEDPASVIPGAKYASMKNPTNPLEEGVEGVRPPYPKPVLKARLNSMIYDRSLAKKRGDYTEEDYSVVNSNIRRLREQIKNMPD